MAGNPLNEILYSKNLYTNSAGSKGKQDWAANNAQKYYSQLDPAEAAKVKGMNGDQLKTYMAASNSTQKSGAAGPLTMPNSNVLPFPQPGGAKTAPANLPHAPNVVSGSNFTPTQSNVHYQQQHAGGPNDPHVTMKFTNEYMDKAGQLMTQLEQMMNKPFSYDYKTDASYIAATDAANKGAAKATDNTLATMADRGIINSSVTAGQLGQIEQTAKDNVLQLLPGMEANAYNRYQTGIGNEFNLLNTTLGAGQWQAGFDSNQEWRGVQSDQWNKQFNADEGWKGVQTDQWNQNFNADQQWKGVQNDQWNKQFQVGQDQWNTSFNADQQWKGVAANQWDQSFNADQKWKTVDATGMYMPDGAQGLINTIVSAKQSFDGASAADKPKISQQAAAARNQLSAMGIDAEKLFGANVGLQQAFQNAGHAGIMTQSAQRNMMDTLMNVGGAYGSLPTGSSNMMQGSPMSGMVKGLEGKPTLQAGQQQFGQWLQKGQFDLSKEEFAFRKTDAANQDAISWANNNLQNRKFEQDQQNYKMDQNAVKATNGYLTQLLGGNIKSREDAMNYIVEHAQDILGDNAHIGTLMDTIDKRYPASKAQSGGQSLDMVDINNKAMSAARQDSRWPKAPTAQEKARAQKDGTKLPTDAEIKATQDGLINEYRQRVMQGTPGN